MNPLCGICGKRCASKDRFPDSSKSEARLYKLTVENIDSKHAHPYCLFKMGELAAFFAKNRSFYKDAEVNKQFKKFTLSSLYGKFGDVTPCNETDDGEVEADRSGR